MATVAARALPYVIVAVSSAGRSANAQLSQATHHHHAACTRRSCCSHVYVVVLERSMHSNSVRKWLISAEPLIE